MPGGAASATVTVVNRRGLHARAAAKLVKVAERFASVIHVCRDDMTVPATSILGLMMLGAGPGTILRFKAEGPDAEEAIRALHALVEGGFDEA